MGFNIHPSYFDDLNRKINILFIMDLLNHCKKKGFTKRDFIRLASSLFLSIENTEIETAFTNKTDYESSYYQIKNSTHHFDLNFDYDFQIGITGFDLKCKPREHVERLIEKHEYDSDILHQYRNILFGAMPSLSNLPYIELNQQTYMSKGNFVTHYVGRFPNVVSMDSFSATH